MRYVMDVHRVDPSRDQPGRQRPTGQPARQARATDGRYLSTTTSIRPDACWAAATPHPSAAALLPTTAHPQNLDRRGRLHATAITDHTAVSPRAAPYRARPRRPNYQRHSPNPLDGLQPQRHPVQLEQRQGRPLPMGPRAARQILSPPTPRNGASPKTHAPSRPPPLQRRHRGGATRLADSSDTSPAGQETSAPTPAPPGPGAPDAPSSRPRRRGPQAPAAVLSPRPRPTVGIMPAMATSAIAPADNQHPSARSGERCQPWLRPGGDVSSAATTFPNSRPEPGPQPRPSLRRRPLPPTGTRSPCDQL